MKTLDNFCIITLLMLFAFGCSKKDIVLCDCPPINEMDTFFILKDSMKSNFIKDENSIIKIVSDGNKTYYLKRNLTSTYPERADDFFQLFNELGSTKNIFKTGENVMEIIYPNGIIDKLIVNVSFTTSKPIYGKVFFNGKEIIVKKSDVPTKNSFVFVLD